MVALAAHVVQREGLLALVRVFDEPTHRLDDDDGDDDNEDNNDNATSTIVDVVSEWVTTAAALLQDQWPHPSSAAAVNSETGVEAYCKMLLHHDPSRTSYYGLACSYLLLRTDDGNADCDSHNKMIDDASREAVPLVDLTSSASLTKTTTTTTTATTVLGHGRLTECFESAGGNAAAATYIVINKQHRGQGLGTALMNLLEKEAQRLGYHFVYLWTRTAVEFYIKACGYRPCHRVSLKRACLQQLTVGQVQGLEAVLMRRQQQEQAQKPNEYMATAAVKQAETVMLLPGDNTCGDNNNDDVWLRKRLVEHVGSVHISQNERRQELLDFIATTKDEHDDNSAASSSIWYVRWNPDIPFQPQIGPSCGLAALRMVREYCFATTEDGISNPAAENGDGGSPVQFPSLLAEAQARGYTQEGEVFDAKHLERLAVEVCELPADVETVDTLSLSVPQVDAILQKGGAGIIAYDSNPRTKLPTKLMGQHAHWGLVVGILYRVQGERQDDDVTVLENNDQHAPPLVQQVATSNCFLCVQHSLSSQWAVACWEDWISSNHQLVSMDKKKFFVSESGMNLKGKFILVKLNKS